MADKDDTKGKGPSKSKVQRVCSFCGKLSSQVLVIIEGPSANICNECISQCSGIVTQKIAKKSKEQKEIPPPHELKELLDKYVIGQDDAKKVLSVAVYNHYKRIRSPIVNDVELEKSNIMMLGPTGCGKTHLIKTISKIIGVPIYLADATQYSITGYVGMDVTQMLSGLLAAKEDITLCQQGIIYIDEIDKIAGAPENPGLTRDVSGGALQQGLLRMIEGAVMEVPANRAARLHPHQETIPIDTTNILFIVGGAFVGLDKIIKKRVGAKPIGFGAEIHTSKELVKDRIISKWLRQVVTKDMVDFGIIPELVGRLPVTTVLDELSTEDLIQILTTPKNAIIKQYQAIFEMDGVKLTFDEESLVSMAEEAHLRKTGARGLRSKIELVMLEKNYNIKKGGKTVLVTKKIVEEVLKIKRVQ